MKISFHHSFHTVLSWLTHLDLWIFLLLAQTMKHSSKMLSFSSSLCLISETHHHYLLHKASFWLSIAYDEVKCLIFLRWKRCHSLRGSGSVRAAYRSSYWLAVEQVLMDYAMGNLQWSPLPWLHQSWHILFTVTKYVVNLSQYYSFSSFPFPLFPVEFRSNHLISYFLPLPHCLTYRQSLLNHWFALLPAFFPANWPL